MPSTVTSTAKPLEQQQQHHHHHHHHSQRPSSMDKILSPNEIPLRTSSAGISVPRGLSKAVLRPLPEESWLGSKSSAVPETSGQQTANGTLIPFATSQRPARPSHKDNLPNHQMSSIDTLIHSPAPTWSASKETLLLAPYEYMFSHPGKDIRSQLISSFDAWLSVPSDSLAAITHTVGMLHTSSLLVDDVEDSSHLRRGVPCAHVIYGTAQTINSSNYVYFLALAELQKLMHSKQAVDVYAQEMLNLHRGQGMDLYWRDTLTVPTEDDYLEMVSNKTGGLFRLAVKLMATESSLPHLQALIPLVNTIGLLFQILDDYLNLQSAVYTQNKGLAEDLEEGKFSFPIIHSIREEAKEGKSVLLNVLRQKPSDDEVKRFAVGCIDAAGSFAYTRTVLRDLTGRAMELINEVDDAVEAVLDPSIGDNTTDTLADGEDGRKRVRRGDGVRAILERLQLKDDPMANGSTT